MLGGRVVMMLSRGGGQSRHVSVLLASVCVTGGLSTVAVAIHVNGQLGMAAITSAQGTTGLSSDRSPPGCSAWSMNLACPRSSCADADETSCTFATPSEMSPGWYFFFGFQIV